MALFVDLVALSNGLHGSVQMDLVALFSWIGWLRHHGIFRRRCEHKPTSFENAIRLQFDTLMKKVIDGIIKNYEKELDRRSNREIPFCELPKIVVNSFPVFDDYELDVTIFDVYGMEARVSGNELCKALQQLPERKRNNLLMFYFLDMSDTEIAELQHISRAGVFKNRQVALHNMKKILQEEK